MVQGRKVIWTAARVLGLAGAAAAVFTAIAQPAPAAQQQASTQQAIPDAPRAQALPDLRTITPVGAAITPPAPQPPSASDGQATPPTSLSKPATGAQTKEDQDTEVPPPAQGPNAFRIVTNVNFVDIPFTVKDSKGQLVPGIPPREIQVFENNVRQRLALFTVDPFPLSVAIVIDQSVTYDTMTKINNALSALQGAFTPYDQVAVFTYNNGVKMQTAFTGAQSPRLGVILERSKTKGRDPLMPLGGPLSQGINLNGTNIDRNTSGHPNNASNFEQPPKEFHTLNDAILAAATETTHAAKGRRRIVYVISDGKEYGSKASEKEVIKYCLTNNVSVWATLVGDSAIKGLGFLDRIHLPLTMRDDVLPRYAGATAGQIDAEFRQGGIETSFAKITEQVRNQYTVGYYSQEPMLDGKYRKIDVRVLRPNLSVIAKDGYYPRPTVAQHAPEATPTAIP
jgi:VWFA-related protein